MKFPEEIRWASTCQSYFVSSVYRVFPSEVRNPLGKVIASTSRNYDYVVRKINLDYKIVPVAYNFDNLAALKAKYGKSVKISDSDENATVLVTSEDENVSTDKMVEEFEIEQYDDYLDRARELRLEEGNLE